MRTVADYREALRQQLPGGIVWTGELDSNLMRLLEALGAELLAGDEDAEHALAELQPAETTELLEEWEAAAGLPDPCTGPLETTIERRAALLARLTNAGGQAPEFYLALAAALGYSINTEIEEFRPMEVGISEAGEHLDDDEWAFVWVFHGPYTAGTDALVGEAQAGDTLGSFGNESLECTLVRVKPAHTLLHFAYDLGLVIMEPVRAACRIPAAEILQT